MSTEICNHSATWKALEEGLVSEDLFQEGSDIWLEKWARFLGIIGPGESLDYLSRNRTTQAIIQLREKSKYLLPQQKTIRPPHKKDPNYGRKQVVYGNDGYESLEVAREIRWTKRSIKKIVNRVGMSLALPGNDKAVFQLAATVLGAVIMQLEAMTNSESYKALPPGPEGWSKFIG